MSTIIDSMNNTDASVSTQHKVIIMHGYTHDEINTVMKAVKSLFTDRRNLVFAKTTKKSLQMKLGELIEDMCEDHEYLLEHPPLQQKPDTPETATS